MRLKLIYTMVALGCAAALVGCSDGEFAGVSETGSAPETVAVTLTASRPSGAHTRTLLQENTVGGLNSTWSAGDKLLVVAPDGTKAGELTLQTGAESTEGVFSGELQITDGTKARVWYLGANNGDDAPYTSAAVSSDGKVTALTTDLRTNFGGKFDDLKRADLLTKEDVVFTVKDGKGYVQNERVELSAKMAMAHFTLKFPDDFVPSGEATLTVNSEDGDLPSKMVWNPLTSDGSTPSEDASYGYSLALGSEASGIVLQNNRADVYLPIVPGSYKLKFDVSAGGKQYTCSLKNKSTIEGGYYYTSGKSSESSSTFDGISVSLVEVSQPVKEDEDLVGGVFEVNGKKFRFTRGNLKYDIENDQWSLFDEQYRFTCLAGWADKEGVYMPTIMKNAKDFALPAYAPVIDLFGFGATGLYDYVKGEYAQYPQFFRRTKIETKNQAEYYYPTNDLTTNSGYTGGYLSKGIQYKAFDWGYAYYLSKNSEAKPSVDKPYTTYEPDPLSGKEPAYRYFTLTSDDWTALKKKYFMAACTILQAGNTVDSKSKGSVYGCLIFPVVADDETKAQILQERNKNEKVMKMLSKVSGITTTIYVKTIENLTFTTNTDRFNADWIKMTVEQFKQLEALGVVFLPQAGYRAEDSLTTTSGYYWTATAGQDRTSTIFRFDGTTTPKQFKLDSQIGRVLGCSVRLVKEVPADYVDPMVVE